MGGSASASLPDDPDAILAEEMRRFEFDPLGYVLFVFDWGHGDLAGEDGPDKWQADLLRQIGEAMRTSDTAVRFAVASGHGVGKAMDVDLVVDTPTGKKRWGDIQIGDLVFGRTGAPTRVTGVFPQGKRPVFKVTLDDGSATRVCGEHLWTVNHRKRGWETRSTAELSEEGVRRANGEGRVRNFHLPVTGPAEFPYQWVPVDPYTLGAWLGDGCRNTSRIVGMDVEVFERIASAGYRLTENASDSSGRASVFNVSMLKPMLAILGLDQCGARTKHVPERYRQNLPEVRAEVLRGLLDTDGYVTAWGTVQFTSASERLVHDVMWLARSLGGKARQPRVGRENAFTCTLTMPDGFRLFYIERKQRRVRETTQKRYLERYIDSIEPDGFAEVMCIKIEAEDALYLANDFICTHNTALSAWIIHWFMATRPGCAGDVTANTKDQLEGKTWRELAKWNRRAINGHWFDWTATAFKSVERPDYWFIKAQPWSKERSEAFAGRHEGDVLMLMDEASAIDDIIWEVTEGALTQKGALQIALGNLTRASGRFRECFGRRKHRWHTTSVDSRSAKMTNKAQIQEWIEDYGEDSDFVRVRIKGEAPRAGDMQFMSTDLVSEAMAREPVSWPNQPLVMGVDVARFGSDQSVIAFRRGRDACSIPWKKYRSINTMELAAEVAMLADRERVDAIFVEGGGSVGAGVIDRLRMLHRPVIEVIPSVPVKKSRAGEGLGAPYNKRAEMWLLMREWLATGAIPDDQELEGELISVEYGYAGPHDALLLEKKERMKERGLSSPDCADALALTFAEPVADKSEDTAFLRHSRQKQAQDINYVWADTEQDR